MAYEVVLEHGMVMNMDETLYAQRQAQTREIESLVGKRFNYQSPSGKKFSGVVTGVAQRMFGPDFVLQDDRGFEVALSYFHGKNAVEV